MRVLVACEESQAVCKAFRAKGHEAYSCDLQECSGGHPEWHIQDDALHIAYNYGSWDLMIAHPPCTYLSSAGMHYLKKKPERPKQLADAFDFVLKLWNAPINKICLENPTGWLNTNWKKHTQIIEPYYFGDNEVKRTCLWLKNLPRLNGNPLVHHRRDRPKHMQYCERIKRVALFANGKMDFKLAAKLKSKTFPGIAKAMAEQWG